MKTVATAFTALVLAASAGAAFANTSDAAYNTKLVPSSEIYAAPAHEGINAASVTTTTGTAKVAQASDVLTNEQRDAENLSANSGVNVTVFPRDPSASYDMNRW